MTTKRRARALLIGVESYSNLGSDKQLRAGRNDVLAFWKVCRRLGFSPENIHVFTSPKLDVQDLVWAEQELADELDEYQGKTEAQIEARIRAWFPPNDMPRVFLSEATRDAILGSNGLQWLAQGVAKDGEPPFDRMLTYSGHGTTIDEDGKPTLALCPTDLVQGKSETALSINAFKQELKDVDDNLTVVLDCCFAQSAAAPRGAHRVATLSGPTSDKPLELDASGLGARVFCASGPNESSYQALIGGYWYSAFSWAMTVALEQWRIARGEGNKRHSTVSHAELLFRARMLLEALSFPQHPVLLDHLGNRPVFGQLDAEEASAEPNQERRNGQIDPSAANAFTILQIYDAATLILTGIITSDNDKPVYGFEKNKEYWYPAAGVSTFSSSTNPQSLKLQISFSDDVPKKDDGNAYAPNDAPRQEGEAATWTRPEMLPDFKSQYTVGDKTTDFGFRLTISRDRYTQKMTVGLNWYNESNSNLFNGVKEKTWNYNKDINRSKAEWWSA